MWPNIFFFILSVLSGDAAVEAPVAGASESLLPLESQVQAVETMTQTKPKRSKHIARSKARRANATQVAATQASSPSVAPTVPEQPALRVAIVADANSVIGKVQDFYNKTQSFTANFTQTVTNQTFNKLKPKVSKGRVYILKPGKMRWDYKNKSYKTANDPKVSKSFISDGKHLWAVMHKNKQYYKEDLTGSTLPVAVSFLMGTGDLRKEFDVAYDTAGKFGSKSDILLVLTPKRPSARYKKLWLVVDTKNHSVKQSIVLNSKGDTNAIRFDSTKVNDGKLKAGHFIFNAQANKDFRLIKPPQ